MIGSCLMTNLKGPVLLKEEKVFIISQGIAGLILFKRNIQSFKQTQKLCSELKSLTRPPPLIAIDMEGGEVDRFSHLKESFRWPSPHTLSSFSYKKIFHSAQAMARQLCLLGIDINFAPVVDWLLVENPLLKKRVLGRSQQEILKTAEPFIEGLIKGGVIPCLKHFPGHGGVFGDSHKVLPKDKRSLKEIEPQLDIFQNLFNKYSCWIMTAHIEFSNIDKKPASFSKIFLKNILRDRQGFKGLVVSDDIDMSALKDFSIGERFFLALKGGCNLVLTCQREDSPKEIIKYFQQNPHKKAEIKKQLEISSKKILKTRSKKSFICRS